MPSGWDVYYVVFLSALLALGIPAILALVSYFFARGEGKRAYAPARAAIPDEARRVMPGKRINARFFLGANAALVLIALVLALVPCAGALRPESGADSGAVLLGLASIVLISGFAALGLLYSAKKGDLSWLRSFQRRE